MELFLRKWKSSDMLSFEEYLKNPCGTLSIPYWKAKNISLPNDMKIVHDSKFCSDDLTGFLDERYFRLFHDMKNIENLKPEGFIIKTAEANEFSVIAEIINASYDDIKTDAAAIERLTETPVYDGNLWIFAEEEKSGKAAGCAIADFDPEAKELIIEWVQVLPEFRRKGVGKLLVNEVLRRGKAGADFATVSGKADCESKPEMLYRACGFKGNDIWHIMRRKKKTSGSFAPAIFLSDLFQVFCRFL